MTSRRLTAAEKGKGIETNTLPPTRKRFRAPEFDNSRLIQDNTLTLIGRLTHPSEQLITQLLNELPRSWTLKGKVVGSDLGGDCFQFKLDREDDVQSVLNNRPYQFNRWMIILQRWEPIISPSFPSQIPFWIRLQGLPLHFWHQNQKVIYEMGQTLGTLEDYEISNTQARIRILMDSLEPLSKDAVMELSSGEETIITLDYEGLGNICSQCRSLMHLTPHCPMNIHKALMPEKPNENTSHNMDDPTHQTRDLWSVEETTTTQIKIITPKESIKNTLSKNV